MCAFVLGVLSAQLLLRCGLPVRLRLVQAVLLMSRLLKLEATIYVVVVHVSGSGGWVWHMHACSFCMMLHKHGRLRTLRLQSSLWSPNLDRQ